MRDRVLSWGFTICILAICVAFFGLALAIDACQRVPRWGKA